MVERCAVLIKHLEKASWAQDETVMCETGGEKSYPGRDYYYHYILGGGRKTWKITKRGGKPGGGESTVETQKE